MASSKKLILNHTFKKDHQKVYSTVLDLQKFGEYHPYMTDVTVLKQTETYTEYHIKEKVLILGFIPQRPEYDAKVFEVEKNKHIRYTSLVMGKINLTINFYFNDPNEKGELVVRENIHLEGNPFLCGIMLGMMEKAHVALFRKF